MPSTVEVYTAEAAISGSRPARPELRETLEETEGLTLQHPTIQPLDRAADDQPKSVVVPLDDILVASDEGAPRFNIHANWHDVVLDLGPYRVTGVLPMQPGFDPGRALTRPGSTFLAVRDVALELIDHPEAGRLERSYVLVNRYAVDRVASDLVLAFFFPAARFETSTGVPVA